MECSSVWVLILNIFDWHIQKLLYHNLNSKIKNANWITKSLKFKNSKFKFEKNIKFKVWKLKIEIEDPKLKFENEVRMLKFEN